MAKTALVVSGGGSRGAFAVGALEYIQNHVRPVDQFDIYCGTSTGSLIVPLAACGELQLLRRLYTTTRQNDVLILGGITNLARSISLHDAQPLKRLIDRTVTDAHFAQIQRRGVSVFITTVSLQTERLVYWATQPLRVGGDYDVESISSANLLRGAMLASSCQPVFMQPVEIRGQQYVDGGVREVTPLQAAIDAGADTIISITLTPETLPPQPAPLTKASQILERTIDMFSEDVGQNDYRLARLYQRGNQYLQAIRNRLLASGVPAGVVDNALAQAGNPFTNTAVTTIHEIRPQRMLEGGGPGGLLFDPAAMELMRQRGFAEARAFFEALAPAPVQDPTI
ncbi:patatin-like phospholipase family protein [Telluribacter sp. SYSU D00476]|uniref:patatin-like phospholipase family protein n=1 Tax=Telluribacter sp. SYSU D00476 TaxID=2811430 RepID=UPI001FF4C538|nr:patatin-like phospholipase family protein [Telluribacter sp. SYSU D00476]